MNKWILLGIILATPAVILVEGFIISLLIELFEVLIDDIASLIDAIKDSFGGDKK